MTFAFNPVAIMVALNVNPLDTGVFINPVREATQTELFLLHEAKAETGKDFPWKGTGCTETTGHWHCPGTGKAH